MNYMFNSAAAFNQDISAWDVSQVQTMERMFANDPSAGNGETSFNQDLSSWCPVNVNSYGDFADQADAWVLPKPNFASPPADCP